MKVFRILLALAIAGATFYSLNVLAIQNGYHDRLDFKNKHFCAQERNTDCHSNKGFNRHREMRDSMITPIDSTKLDR